MKRLLEIIKRELRFWLHEPEYMIGSICVMVFCSIFYLTFMKDGVPDKLPIGVVDYDESSLTRNFISQLNSTQLGDVVMYPDFEAARDDMEKGVITSVCVLPKGMYADVQAQRQPEFTFYVNTLYFLGGSLAYKDILTMINLTSGAVQRQVLRMKGVNENAILGRIRPVDIDIHMLDNPTMNYGSYLANMMLPGVLEMIIIILTIYSLGIEMKKSTGPELLSRTAGKLMPALYGKMIPYTLLFTLMGFILMFVLYGWMNFPLKGSIVWMLLDVLLLVMACQSVAVMIVSCVPVLRFALSIGALYSVMAFSLTGFTLPVEAMPRFIQGLSNIFPLRHYYQMYVQAGMYATGFAGSYMEIVHLLLFQFLPLGFLLRLKDAYIHQNYPKK